MSNSDELYHVLGRRVRRRREQLDRTQDELAAQVGLTRTSITNIEQGRQKIQVHMLYSLAAALDTAVIALLPLIPAGTRNRADIEAQLPPGLDLAEQEWIIRILTQPEGNTDATDDTASPDPASN